MKLARLSSLGAAIFGFVGLALYLYLVAIGATMGVSSRVVFVAGVIAGASLAAIGATLAPVGRTQMGFAVAATGLFCTIMLVGLLSIGLFFVIPVWFSIAAWRRVASSQVAAKPLYALAAIGPVAMALVLKFTH